MPMKTKMIFCVLLLLVTYSCTTDVDNVMNDKVLSSATSYSNSHRISEAKAMNIANGFFKQTRANANFSVNYVINKDNPRTRSAGISDTLAYIFNRSDDNGFMVVASDDRVFPILAFSDTGHFEYEESEDDAVYVNFISRLDDYLASIDDNDTTVIVPDDYLYSCVIPDSSLNMISWSQNPPFDKYVIQEHPGCPAGCVAVATGLAMVYAKNSLKYHGVEYDFKSLRYALRDTDKSGARFPGEEDEEPAVYYTYEEAIDTVAKLLYLIGKDLDLIYTEEGTYGVSSYVIPFLKELEYTVSPDFLTYDDEAVANNLYQGDIIYMSGLDLNGKGGHAWILDGVGFCWKNPVNKTGFMNVVVHCDWGWGGRSNGFYSGDVFETDRYTYGFLEYFAVSNKNGLLRDLTGDQLLIKP